MSRADPQWIGELMKSLRIAPGSKVDLPEDFDPGYTADFVEKEDAERLMAEGVQLLSTYQLAPWYVVPPTTSGSPACAWAPSSCTPSSTSTPGTPKSPTSSAGSCSRPGPS